MNRKRQSGLAAVEFAIVGVVLMMLMFGVIEISRAFFVSSALNEATRRAARLAAVCPVDDPAINQVGSFNGEFVTGLDSSKIDVEYLNEDGDPVTGDLSDPAKFAQIHYVEATVTDFEHQLMIPFFSGIATFTMPDFVARLPRESLGIPRDGVVTPC